MGALNAICPQTEPTTPDYTSVEVTLPTLALPYQFRLRSDDAGCAYFWAKENSAFIRELKEGMEIEAKLYAEGVPPTAHLHRVRIAAVQPPAATCTPGHCRVLLEIVEKKVA